MLAPELTEVWEGFGSTVSIDVVAVSAMDASSMVEAFDSKDVAGPVAVTCAPCDSPAPVELGGGVPLPALVSDVAGKISLRT